MLDYILIAQYRIYVPNSWKLYLFKFLPDYWANVVGGNIPTAGVIMIITFITFAYKTLKRKIQGEIFILGIIFAILLVIIRYYRGERFDGYMIYIAPLIFLLSGWALVSFYDLCLNFLKNVSFLSYKIRLNAFKTLSILFFVIVIVSEFDNAKQFIFSSISNDEIILKTEKGIIEAYPNQKFHLYDYWWRTSDYSYLLGEYLFLDGKLNMNGMPIAVVQGGSPPATLIQQPLINYGGWKIQSLTYLHKSAIKKPEWSPVNPSDIYDDLMKWQKSEELTTTFYLDKYILERLHLN